MELAERIWNWEQDIRKQNNLPKFEYNMQTGLRLVSTLVDEVLETHPYERNDPLLESDLVQEGLSALLNAMGRYRQYCATNTSPHHVPFDILARSEIRRYLSEALDDNDVSRPVRLPRSVQTTIYHVKTLISKHVDETGRPPKNEQLAKELQISIEQLEELVSLSKRNKKAAFIVG